jgi:hypothetical protein
LNENVDEGTPMEQLIAMLRQLLTIFEDGVQEGFITQR